MHWAVSVDNGPYMINHAAASLGNDIYYICHTKESVLMHVLRTESLEWEVIPPRTNEERLNLPDPFLPHLRRCNTVFAYNDKIYKWGGRDFLCNLLYCFDPKTLSWSLPKVKGNIPLARDGYSSCVVGDCLYIYGGYLTSGTRERTDDVCCLNFETMEWTDVPTTGDRPAERDFHSAVAVDDRMYIFGGRCYFSLPYFQSTQMLFSEKVYYLDLKTRVWHCPEITGNLIPLGRHSFIMFTYNCIIYVFGGVNGHYKKHLNDLHAYNPITNTWQLLTPPGKSPKPRRLAVGTVLGSKMFLFGGVSEYYTFDDLHVLDFLPSLQTLSMVSAVEHGRSLEMLPDEIQRKVRSIIQPL